MPSRNRAAWKLPLLLAAVELATFAVFLPGLGFYLDDWDVLSHSVHLDHAGLLATIAAFLQETKSFYYLRPLDAVYFPALYWLCGWAPWKYHAVILVLETATALLLFHALKRTLQESTLAFMTVCLYIGYPNHGATHYWYNAGFTHAMFFLSASALLHVLWTEKRSYAALAVSLLCFAVGDLIYEAIFPLLLILPLLSLLRGLRLGQSPRQAGRQAALSSLPLAAVSASLFAYNILIQKLFPKTIERQIMFDPIFILKVIGKGFECSSTAIFDLFRRSLAPALHGLPPALWIIGGAGLVGLAFTLPSRSQQETLKSPSARAWLLGAAILFVGAYAPYAISKERYLPHIFDVQNRLNAAASLPAAMLLAWCLGQIGERPRKIVFFTLMAVFSVINWQSGSEWAQAWSLQRQILDSVAGQLPAPSGAQLTITLKNAPNQVGNAPVFTGDWVFDEALRDVTLRRDISGLLDKPGRPAALIYDFTTGRLERAPKR